MAHDEIRAPQTAPEKERPPAGRMLLFGGVAAACIAGAGLGLWARPVESEQPGGVRPAPAPVAEAPAVDRRLHVVVDDAPAPVGEPLAVLPQAPARAAAPVAPEPLAAKRPPLGLMRVAAPVIAALALPERKAAPPAPQPAPPPALEAPKPRPVTVAKAAPEPKKAAVVRLAHAEHAQPARKAPPVKLAKAEPKHARLRAHEVEVAEEAPPPKPRRALLALAHVIEKVAQRHARDDDEDNVRASRARDHARKPAVREVRVSKPAARPKAPPKVERYIPPLSTKGAGPIKVTNVTTRCASPDPGEALACGDPALSAAQRRLNRAYAEAVAAGVSPSTLERQQQRWLAARAAAAREAPWAVREVYQARIAELQDLTRDARGE